jgi:endonuclease/exonuclease/phosphatase (EEP) superfamily protein YafD
VLAAWALTPAIAGAGWVIDLMANLVAQAGVAALGLGLTACIVRRFRRQAWVWLAIAAACVVSVGLAPRAPHRSGLAPPAQRVRIGVYNAHPAYTDPAGAIAAVAALDADVVLFTEAPTRLARQITAGALEPRFGWSLVRRPQRGERPWQAAVSRWPLVLLESPPETDALSFRVERPGSPFVVVGLHPPSPRSARDWADGNAVVGAAARFARGLLDSGQTVVIAADLNGAPTGYRSRLLASEGFRRAKPGAAPAGTYPAAWPWPASVAIDDVFVPRGAAVLSWATSDGAGSDHRIVVVEVSMAPGSPSSP